MQKIRIFRWLATTASLFNDAGTQDLFIRILNLVDQRAGSQFLQELQLPEIKGQFEKTIIPPARVRYLSEIHESILEYNNLVDAQCRIATTLYQLSGAVEEMKTDPENQALIRVNGKPDQEIGRTTHAR